MRIVRNYSSILYTDFCRNNCFVTYDEEYTKSGDLGLDVLSILVLFGTAKTERVTHTGRMYIGLFGLHLRKSSLRSGLVSPSLFTTWTAHKEKFPVRFGLHPGRSN